MRQFFVSWLPRLCLSSVLVCLPLNADPADDKAEVLFQRSFKEDDVAALRTLWAAVAIKPDERIYFRIGFLYHKMNRRKEAFEAYSRTLELDRCHAKALNNLGGLEHENGQDEAAFEYYMRAQRCNSDYYLTYYNLGNMYRERKLDDHAEKAFIKSLSLNEKHARSHHNLGVLYLDWAQVAKEAAAKTAKKGENYEDYLTRAELHLKRALELEKTEPLFHYNMGAYYVAVGDACSAKAEWTQALRFTGNDSNLRGVLTDQLRKLRCPRASDGVKF